mgnify:CR=1 FL=1
MNFDERLSLATQVTELADTANEGRFALEDALDALHSSDEEAVARLLRQARTAFADHAHAVAALIGRIRGTENA